MSLLEMSVTASVITLVVTGIRAVTIHRLPKTIFLILWGVVLCRLLLPFSIASPYSVYMLLGSVSSNAGLFSDQTAASPIGLAGNSISFFLAEKTAVPPKDIPWSLIIWGTGLIVCMLYFAISYWRCRRKFATAMPVQSEVVQEWKAEYRSNRRITVRLSDRIAAPLTYGMIHPIILLPKWMDWSNKMQLRYILAHEAVHIRRFDSLTKLLLIVALCIHWFNPFVWLMFFLANRDIELSCDEAVVRLFGEPAKAAYARALIHMEEKKSNLMPLCNHFSKNAMEERIMAIMKINKTSAAAWMVSLLLVGCVVVVFATSSMKSTTNSAQINGDTVAETKKTVSEKFTKYADLGILYTETHPGSGSGNVYYDGKLVKSFSDATADSGIFFYQSKSGGSIDIFIEQSQAGTLQAKVEPILLENVSSLDTQERLKILEQEREKLMAYSQTKEEKQWMDAAAQEAAEELKEKANNARSEMMRFS